MGFRMKGSEFYGKPGAFKKASGFKETDPKKKSTSATSNLLDRLSDYEGQVKEKAERDNTLKYTGKDTTPDDQVVTLDKEGRENKARAQERQKRNKAQSMGDHIANQAKSDAASAKSAEKEAARDAEIDAMKAETARRNAMTAKERRKEDRQKNRG
tara:strand:- start:191 stop:658 length:468 start_codon:yes stop_codon:yes gene_type:complete